jgi:hypothetical protein
MKKRLFCLAICLLLCACSFVRGSGRLITESREVRGFERVALTGSGDLILTQGERESLTVQTDANVMQYVVTEVSGGTLTLGTEIGTSISPTRLTFTLTVVDLDGITVSGSGSAEVERLRADVLEVKVSGSGDARIDTLEAREVRVQVTGSGSVELAGQVGEQTVKLSGSGKYAGGDLRSETASVTTSGSGDATVWVTESLDARATGSGSVRYYGRPQTSFSGSGSGDLKQLRDK